jgi:hypothetical protein
MPNYITRNINLIRARHYVRNATASNHWFDFSQEKMANFKNRYGDNFCLIINGSKNLDDAYIIPYTTAKRYFSVEYLDDNRPRWVGTIIDDRLKLGSNSSYFSVGQYHNKFDLLEL